MYDILIVKLTCFIRVMYIVGTASDFRRVIFLDVLSKQSSEKCLEHKTWLLCGFQFFFPTKLTHTLHFWSFFGKLKDIK